MRRFKFSKHLKSKKIKSFTLVLASIFVLVALAFFAGKNRTSLEASSKDKDAVKLISGQKGDQADSVDLAAVGDMLPHETVTKAARVDSGYDYLNLISPELRKSFQKAELRFCNQESPSAASIGARGYPSFNAPAQFPKDLSAFGCNIISTGNNHAADSGQVGIDGTLAEWTKLKPLAISGTNSSEENQNKLQIFEKGGIKFGFVAFSQDSNSAPPNSFSVNRLGNLSLVSSQITELRKQVDVVIISAHWGTEDSHTVNSAQKNSAQKLADLGADIVIGSGPHVWQPYVKLKGSGGNETHVWYSIGNGLNSQTKVDQLFSGVALLKITKLKSGSGGGDGRKVKIDSPRILPTYMHYVWGSGVGTSSAKLLDRTKLKWLELAEPEVPALIAERNDFKTSKEEQLAKLESYLANDSVQIIN